MSKKGAKLSKKGRHLAPSSGSIQNSAPSDTDSGCVSFQASNWIPIDASDPPLLLSVRPTVSHESCCELPSPIAKNAGETPPRSAPNGAATWK